MFKPLNPILHSELRLSIMSLLISLREADFMYILEQTKATAGNLSVQIEKLNKVGYIEVIKAFNNRKPCTKCKITLKGIEAFEEYVHTIKLYIEKE